MRNRVLLAGLAWAGVAGGLAAQPPAPDAPKPESAARPAPDLFRDAQALIRVGRFDMAAQRLRAFLDANPTDADFLALARTDPATFQKLRTVAQWSDDPAANAEAIKTREDVIARSDKAFRAAAQDDKRIRQLVRNLAGVREERLFAVQELGKLGTAPVPAVVDELRTTQDPDLRAGIFDAVRTLPAETVPAFLGATGGLPADASLGILRAVAGRPDVLSLVTTAETDFTPFLWHYSGPAGGDGGPLRAFAVSELDRLSGGRAGRLKAEDELVRLAEPFAAHTARFRGGDRPTLWTWDAGKTAVVGTPATKAEAEEYFAVRNLRWALERSPNDPAAQELFLAVTTERAVERAELRDLASADPTLYRILAAAPAGTLVGLLDRAMTDKRTSLAVGLSQVLAARGDRAAAETADPGRPAVLVKALDYPDARVQFNAAQGLLRSPGGAPPGKQARIVDILRRAAAAEADPPGAKSVGRALVADPLDTRGEKTARYLRALGYAVERLPNGRSLLRRAGRAADYDLIVLDRHLAAPTLQDTLAQLRAGTAGGRPILLVASADSPTPVPVEQLLARLAALNAVLPDDLDRKQPITVEPAFAFDPRKPVADEAAARADLAARRDRALDLLYLRRLSRLQQYVEAAALPTNRVLSERLGDRLPQLVLAGLAAKYGITPSSAPRMHDRLQYYAGLIAQRPATPPALERLPADGLGRLVESLESSLADRREYDALAARLESAVAANAGQTADELDAAARLGRLAKLYPAVTVIAEPFALGAAKSDGVGFGLAHDLATATAQPADKPVPAEYRKTTAKQAVRWLRALAVGEHPGYDIRPAEPALRQALRDDDLADDAIDAVARIPSAEAQQDLLNLALSLGRPLPLRARAARNVARHMQSYGKFIPAGQAAEVGKQANTEPDPGLRASLLVIEQLAAGKPGDVGRLMAEYPPPLPKPPAAAAQTEGDKKPADGPPPVEKKDEGK